MSGWIVPQQTLVVLMAPYQIRMPGGNGFHPFPSPSDDGLSVRGRGLGLQRSIDNRHGLSVVDSR
jgi:hypothetical protein